MGRSSIQLSSSPPPSDETTKLSDLNTRDILLLSQLAEEHGIDNYSKIHQELISHPAFNLSHNRLDNTQLELSTSEVEHLINELLTTHKDLKIVSICEHYYKLRLQELMTEIRDTKSEFDQAKLELS